MRHIKVPVQQLGGYGSDFSRFSQTSTATKRVKTAVAIDELPAVLAGSRSAS
jgi:hypothetical protein